LVSSLGVMSIIKSKKGPIDAASIGQGLQSIPRQGLSMLCSTATQYIPSVLAASAERCRKRG
jgi:hypothetical protein